MHVDASAGAGEGAKHLTGDKLSLMTGTSCGCIGVWAEVMQPEPRTPALAPGLLAASADLLLVGGAGPPFVNS